MIEEVLKQALAALESCTPQDTSTGHVIYAWHDEELVNGAIAALKERLTQPEQEPVAWLDPWTRNNVTTDYDAYGNNGIPLYAAPPQRNPLTDEQRQELMSKAWNKWLSRKDDGRLFAWDFSFEVEAAHGIKENT